MAHAAHHPLTNSHAAAHSPLRDLGAWIGRAYHRWQERSIELRELEQMAERDLRDAGLSRWAVRQELSKPFWRE
jgi:uncharacterized protein YjiS (DUF1127 family)